MGGIDWECDIMNHGQVLWSVGFFFWGGEVNATTLEAVEAVTLKNCVGGTIGDAEQ